MISSDKSVLSVPIMKVLYNWEETRLGRIKTSENQNLGGQNRIAPAQLLFINGCGSLSPKKN